MRLDAIDLQNDGIWFLLRSIKENLGFFCDNTTVISFFENIFNDRFETDLFFLWKKDWKSNDLEKS